MARSSKLAALAVSLPESETDAADVTSRLDLGELDTHIGYFARRFQVWIFQDLIRELARAEIRISHYSVLAIIEANPGLAQSAVAEAVGIEPARLVRVLDELERRGWIQRMRSATDRRSHALYLTQDGQKAFAHVKDLARQHETHVIERLGAAKYESLMRMLKEIDREGPQTELATG
jgi:DNA-binding MarR family transcriptional regulator